MEQDHYKTLGLNRTATKEEIKSAFRESALEFHPDRHSQSSAAIRDFAAAQFKRASEAYETLVDERKRADYDFRWRNRSSNWSPRSSSGYYYKNTTYRRGGDTTTMEFYRSGTSGSAKGFDWQFLSRVMATRGFLLGVGCVSILVGSALFIENVIQDAWRRNNSGKSFEDAMEALKKAKTQKDGDL